jgi:pimeloyl-ACP methyl ester carboxylesterase
VLNALAPTRFRIDDLHAIDATAKPPVLWIRGTEDRIVSDASLFDLAQLGALDAVPGWPGADVCPPQPMVAQTRDALGLYAAAGGCVTELALPETGHSLHLERPKEFLVALLDHVAVSSG